KVRTPPRATCRPHLPARRIAGCGKPANTPASTMPDRPLRVRLAGMKRWVVAALVLVLIGWWMAPPMGRDRAPGVLAPQLPVQQDLHDAQVIEHGDFRLT